MPNRFTFVKESGRDLKKKQDKDKFTIVHFDGDKEVKEVREANKYDNMIIKEYQTKDNNKEHIRNKNIVKSIPIQRKLRMFTFLKDPITNFASTHIKQLNLPPSSLLENLMAIAFCNTTYFSKEREGILNSLFEKLRSLLNRENKLISNIRINNLNDQTSMNNIILHNFFHKGSSTFSLFSSTSFDLNEQPEILKWSILASGLVWMENDYQVSEEIKRIETNLVQLFTSSTNIKPSLQNLQAILLIVINLTNFTNINALRTTLLSLASRFASILGLHLNNPKFSAKIQFERQLAYSNLAFILAFMDLNCGSHSAATFRLMNPNTNNFKIDIKHQKNEKWDIYDKVSLLFANYLSEMSAIMFLLRIAKENRNLKHTESKHFSNLNKVQLQLTNLSKQMIEDLNIYLNQFSTNNDLKLRIAALKKVISLLRHYLLFFILSIQASPSILSDSNNNNASAKQSQENLLLQCQLTIEFAMQLPSHYMVYFPIPILTQCLSYLIQIAEKSKVNQVFIKKGLKRIKQLKKFPTVYWASLAHLAVVQLISDASKG
ncbi:hypothetical protein K502DRAFT_325480 [Neoconidiobolus thromboides FSU 785]|nr:hypothetical protein K502DRAFT_325480 [Neoconidiobolus thromboides FSU 785]